MYIKKCFCLCLLSLLFYSCQQTSFKNKKNTVNNKSITNYITQKYKEGFRAEKDGWIYIHIEGTSYDRGFQYGQLIPKDFYKKNVDLYKDMFFLNTGIEYDFLKSQAIKLYEEKIPQDLLKEMQGIADGLTENQQPTSLEDIIMWNAYLELAWSWLPQALPHLNILKKKASNCSALIATGSATKDNKILLGHSTFDDFYNAQICNVILDIKTDKNEKLIMQTTLGYVFSGIDFFLNNKGIIGCETTIDGFTSYDKTKTPYFIRSRLAMQNATSIDSFIEILNNDNNGGMGATWLIGDTNTNEICKYEQGLYFQNKETIKNGYFFGCNITTDPRIRNLECSDTGTYDIRRHTGGRHARFLELLPTINGKLDLHLFQKTLMDHFDVYLNKENPSTVTICAHSDVDPLYFMSNPNAVHKPFTPYGCVDMKVTSTDLAKNMQFIARWGRACGTPFYVKDFVKKNPIWQWQEKYLINRPYQNLSLFESFNHLDKKNEDS